MSYKSYFIGHLLEVEKSIAFVLCLLQRVVWGVFPRLRPKALDIISRKEIGNW